MLHTRGAIRIGLIGGECTGKSTLAMDLADDLRQQHSSGLSGRVGVVDERLREFVVVHGRAPRSDEQAALMAEQHSAEDAAAVDCDVLIADPATVMTAVYSQLYFDDRSLWPSALLQARGYHVLLWCRPDIPWEPDPGQRDGPAYRQRADEVIAETLVPGAAGLGIGVRQVSGDRRRRRAAAVTEAMACIGALGVWREGQPGSRT